MTKPSNSITTFCGTLILTGALLLSPPPSARGRESAPPEPAAVPSQGDRGGTQEAENATNPNKAKDPCKHQEKHGQKLKPKKQCLPEQKSGGVAKGDFNGDGFGDLAVGVPNEDLGTLEDAGAVNVIYGSSTGLTAANNQFWTEDSPGVLGTAEDNDQFGSSLASGDFNGDGFSDLAVGRPLEDIAAVDQGAVTVLYGSASGLTATGNQGWEQNSTGILDAAEDSDLFGSALVWGDFNSDGFGDLAIGVPREDVGTLEDAGAVHIIYGSPTGLTATNNQFWTQDTALGGALSDAFDKFGSTLAAGDFNKDVSDDLAIGAPNEDVGNINEAGEVDIMYGVAGVGLTSAGSQFWSQNTIAVPDAAEDGDQFGSAIAAGDFSGDGSSDLAIGVPGEDVGTIQDAGAVNVLYGSVGNRLTAINAQFWTQNTGSILDACEANDFFSLALAAGDFNGDGQSDLAIGVPGEDVGNLQEAGAVNVLYGGGSFTPPTTFFLGLLATNNQFWTQNTADILDDAEVFDLFGFALTAWNFGEGSQADLAIGAPGEDVGNIENAGAVNVLYGSRNRLDGRHDQLWHQDVEGILDQAEEGDVFGLALY
jgi:hypothetical protein